jgi:DNA-binding NarL/FixJ family response regulator
VAAKVRQAVDMSDAKSILLIDENTQDREYYAQRLQISSPDYDVVQAATGQSGLDRCARQPIDCVILEIDLPDMSGFEVLAKLVPRVWHPEIAVIVLTRLPNPFFLELALKNGAQAALHKTMTSGDILDTTIRNAIGTVQREKAQHGRCC